MNFPIVHEYRKDILNQNPENRVLGEPFKVVRGPGSRIVIPIHAPFFVKSLRLYNANMEPLTKADDEGVGDWRMYKIMGGLTELTAKPVGCMIEILNPDVTAGFFDYDIVGHFSLFDNSLLRMILETANDDRPVHWEYLRNKPVVFPPEWHGMSLIYDIVAFGDMVELISMIIKHLTDNAVTVAEIKINHYLDLLNHYITVYRTELLNSLARHEGAYDSHGLTKGHVGLNLVDNFATARGDDLLKPNNNMHLTVNGLKTIIDSLSFNASELLASNKVPVSQFGNANFIPPSLDGSFEGIGGTVETSSIALETDGTVTNLANRMDGRVRGLYFSTLDDSTNPSKISLNFTGYKYEHAKFNADSASVDRVAQGSGDECILVGDSEKDLYYLGVTNGSNNPANHVYSKVNLMPLVDAIYSSGVGYRVADIFGWINIAVMGDWIYLILASGKNAPSPAADTSTNMNYRHIFRVPIDSVKATIDVTPVRQNVTFEDADGVQVNNSPWFRWYSLSFDEQGFGTKAIITFSPYASNGLLSGYRSAVTLTAKNPDVPDQYAIKFLTAFYAARAGATINASMQIVPEINYAFNPRTGVFTLKSKTPTFNVDFSASPVVPPQHQSNSIKFSLVFFYKQQGCAVLNDGRIISSGSYGFSGFPRGMMSIRLNNSNTRYDTVSRFWNIGEEFSPVGGGIIPEKTISPIQSGVCPRAFLYANEGEYYISGRQDDQNAVGFYWKTVSGKFLPRDKINNLYIKNIVARPLTNDIRKVNALPGLGGATLSVPSAALDAAGMDVGEMAFCVGSQKKTFNRENMGNAWPGGVGNGDIVLVQKHDRRIEADGTVTIVPTLETLYPEAIVEALKTNVQFPNLLGGSRSTIVTVSDPTFSTLERFGWLPVVVSIQYTGSDGNPNRNTLFTTFLVITPTYIDSGGRKVVTGFTVNNVHHGVFEGTAINTPYLWGRAMNSEGPLTTFGPMRCFYYLEGNTVSVYMDPGVIAQTVGDAYLMSLYFSVTNRAASKLWNFVENRAHSTNGGGPCMTPDNGISFLIGWAGSTGTAATLQNGRVNNPLLGGVYPEIGWTIFAKTAIRATFNGREYMVPPGIIDLRDITPDPANKTFYVYATLVNEAPVYQVTEEKRLETAFQLWVAEVKTGPTQILTIERFNVFAMNGNRVSEIKRGNSIPASSGLANEEGQLPWLRSDELLT